jgi:hypothetical protein
VTETQWLASLDSRLVLAAVSRRISDRKLRFLICACCRRVWDLLVDDRSKEAVEIAEQYADGSATREDLIAVRRKADAAYQWARKQHGPAAFRLFGAAHLALQATSVARKLRFDPREDEFLRGAQERKEKAERKARCDLIRDLVASPSRCVELDAARLAWKKGLIVSLAQTAYDQRILPAGTLSNERLAILADALEEAGCTTQEILSHLRRGGDHVRGCWAVDLILSKDR